MTAAIPVEPPLRPGTAPTVDYGNALIPLVREEVARCFVAASVSSVFTPVGGAR